MPQYRPVTLSNGGGSHPAPQPGQQSDPTSSLQAGVLLGQAVRDEHGREGLRAYVAALNPLLPRALVEQLAHKLGVEVPPPVPPIPHGLAVAQPPPKPPQKEGGAIPPELLLQLLQGSSGGGGLDPSLLLKLLQNK